MSLHPIFENILGGFCPPEPTRADDDHVVALVARLEANGVFVIGDDEPIPTGARLILSVDEVVMLAEAYQ